MDLPSPSHDVLAASLPVRYWKRRMSDATTQPQSTEAELIAVRREKLAKLRSLGVDPFGARFETTISPAELKADFSDEKQVTIAGRIIALRDMGKSVLLQHRRRPRLHPGLPRRERRSTRRRQRSGSASTAGTGSASTAKLSPPRPESRRSRWRPSPCFRNRCARCRTSGTASPTVR